MKTTTLPTPNENLVRSACREFDNDNQLTEEGLDVLFSQYPGNRDLRQVFLKVVALNALYTTRLPIYSTTLPDVEDVARHIVQQGEAIDSALAVGSIGIVERISRIAVLRKEDRNYFSFATKYCSRHKPSAYPIYDRNAEACLWYYKKQHGFAEYRREGYDYAEFVRIVAAFRDFPSYGLASCGFNFKEIDKFLYLYGGRLFTVDAHVSAVQATNS
jgi:hypothetical protein